MPLYVLQNANPDQIYVIPETTANDGTAVADRSFSLPTSVTYNGVSGVGISSPQGCAIDGSDIWVPDAGDDVLRFSADTADGQTAGISYRIVYPAAISNVTGIAVDGNDIYIADAIDLDVYVLPKNTADNGTATASRTITLPATITTIVGLAVDGNDLYILSATSVSVISKSTSGAATVTRSFTFPSDISAARGIAIEGNNLYVTDITDDDIYAVSKNTANNTEASIIKRFNLPSDITLPVGLTYRVNPDANLTISTTETNLYTGKTFDIDITSDADISDFVVGDVTVTGGTANSLTETDAQNFVLNVTAGAVGTMNVAIAEDAVSPGNAAVDEDFTIVARATVGIAFEDSTLETGQSTTATVAFNGAVTGLTLADFSVNVGSVTNLQSTSANAYTVTVTAPATGSGTLTLTLRENAVDQGNAVETESLTYAPPTSTATISTTDTFIVENEQVDFAIAFNRSVTGLTLGDFTISGATGNSVTGSGTSWTLRVTAASGAGQISITLPANSVTPNNAEASASFTRNEALSLGWTVPTSEVGASFSATLTSNYSLTSVAIGDFRLRRTDGVFTTLNSGNTTLTNVSGTNNWRLDITLTGTIDNDFQLRLNANSVNFAGGTAPSANLNSTAFRVDTTIPTFTITSSDSAIYESESFTITIQASEAVTGFTTGDVTVTGATKGAFTAVDGDTYTLGLTAATGAGDIVVSIAENVVDQDNAAASQTFPRLARPTATITVSPTTLTESDSATLTIQFSEAVTGFTTGDITVTGASKGTFTADDGSTYTQAITVNAGSGTVAVSIAAGVTSPPNAAVSQNFTYIADVAPSSPTGFAVATSVTTADLSWVIGADGGSPITATQVTSDNGANWTDISATATSYQFTGLTPDTEYQFAARHVNSVGTGTATATLTRRTLAVTVNLTGPSSVRNSATFDVTVSFNTTVTNLTLSDFTITPNTATLNSLTAGSNNAYTLNATAPATGTGDIVISLPADSVDEGNNADSITIAYVAATSFAITQVGPIIITIGTTNYDLEVPISGTTSNTTITQVGDWEGFYMDWDQPNGILHIRAEEVTRLVGEYVWLITVEEGSDSITGEIVYSVVPAAPVITPITETQPIFRNTRAALPIEITNNADTAGIEGLQVGMKYQSTETGLIAQGTLPTDARLTEETFMAKAIAENITQRVESMIPFEVFDEPKMWFGQSKLRSGGTQSQANDLGRVDADTPNGDTAPVFGFRVAEPEGHTAPLYTGLFVGSSSVAAVRKVLAVGDTNLSELVTFNKAVVEQNTEITPIVIDISSHITEPGGILIPTISTLSNTYWILDQNQSNRRIRSIRILYSPDPVASLTGTVSLPSSIAKPRGFAQDPSDDDLYIVDLQNRRVYVVTVGLSLPNTISISRWFVLPSGNNAPGDIFILGDDCYVIDFWDANEDRGQSGTEVTTAKVYVMDKNTTQGTTATATRVFDLSTDAYYPQAIFVES